MNNSNKQLKKLFAGGLKNYLSEESEKNLTEAYELGRKSLQKGFSKLDIIDLYHEILFENDDFGLQAESKEQLTLASEFLTEYLAPFEVRLRSYQDLIDNLNAKNERLEEEIEHRKEIEGELQKSKDHFQALIENAQDIITVLDYEGIIRYSSPAILRILGYKKEDLHGKLAFDYVHPDDLKYVKKLFEEVVESPEKTVSAEFRFKHKDGSWVFLESIAKNVPDNPVNPIIVVNSRDVTERKKTMRKLKEREAQLSEAQQIAKVGSWEWKPGEEELFWSDELCRIYGFKPEEFDRSFETYISRIHPDDKSLVQTRIEQAMENKKQFEFEHRIIRPDGDIHILLCRGEVVLNQQGEISRMIGTGQDITRQKRREQKLRDYSERLRKLSARIERTREEERIKIAREIHDELGQMLTVLKMDVSMLSSNMKDKISTETYDIFYDKAEEIRERINGIIKSIQRITTELRPEVLDTMGLKEAIDWKSNEVENRTGIDIVYTTNVKEKRILDKERETTLFRIYQESLTNVIRHAMASKVEVDLQKDGEHLQLTVRDNGVGITQGEMDASTSVGLIGMCERAQFLGGDLDISGKEGEGTTISLRIPIDGMP